MVNKDVSMVGGNNKLLTANSQVSENKNLINIEESTSMSKVPFSQALANSVEEIKTQFKDATTCTADVDNDIAYDEEIDPDDALEKAKAIADAIYEKYQGNITSAMDLINSPFVPISYIWEKLFPQGELCLVYGDSSCGKSMILRCVLLAIAYGMEEYLGFKIDLPIEQRKVALVITEDSEKSIRTLLQMQAQYFEQFRTIENPVFDVISSCEEGIVYTLEERMKDVPYSIVVVDTPQDDIEGSMNDNNIVRGYLNQLSSLGAKYNCTMVVIHHKRKYTLDKAPSKEDLSGSRALGDKPRAIFEMRKHVDEDYCVYLTPIKANYEDNSFLKDSYKLRMDPKTLTFEFTGELTPSDQIHLSSQKIDNTKGIKEKIIELKAINPSISQSEISEILREEFPDEVFSQSKVSRIISNLKKHK